MSMWTFCETLTNYIYWRIIMRVNITLSNNETMKTDISRGTYNYIKSRLNDNSVFSDCVKTIEIIKGDDNNE